ncbi:CoxG family protein [Metabacillus malikii]|uniref:Carbon monoxide dehydrogenase subunit G n=1 Tax=Metabacillus malikii TaxID=1504265 RepID=A0ABT9Z9M5_9BACI|nr:SRPBCC family protein [Metabacillus malikii]MDQ0228958.1 carbon monoxide dehydrogenase subunit G [Metabacillus malikii]
MASECYKVQVDLPIETIWSFIENMNNWAPLVPGYINHQMLNEKESTWVFKTDLGMIKKKVELKVEITSWNEPEKVTFKLTGLNEKMSGNGYFEAIAVDERHTAMTGYLEIVPEGAMAKLIESRLKKNLEEMTKEMTDQIISHIKSLENITK